MLLYQRICWNTEGWRKPSGTPFGGGYPKIAGYGAEEWNLCDGDAYGGWIYGFSHWRPNTTDRGYLRDLGCIFDIVFWTISPQDGQIVVALVQGAEFTNPADRRVFAADLAARRRDQRRALELHMALRNSLPSRPTPTAAQILADYNTYGAASGKLVPIRYPVSGIRLFPARPLLPPPLSGGPISHHYQAPSARPESSLDFLAQLNGARGRSRITKTAANLRKISQDSYQAVIAAQTREVQRSQNALAIKLETWLTAAPRTCIDVAFERERVDITWRMNNQSYIGEIKICRGRPTRLLIREALGQLLEYNLYPGRAAHDHWVIVIDKPPTDDDQTFLRDVARILRASVFLIWPSRGGFKTTAIPLLLPV